MKNISRKKKNSNIFHIADNPRFKKEKEQKYISIPSTLSKDGQFASYEVASDAFGFKSGDQLVCRKDFDSSEFGDNTLVIDNSNNRNTLKPAAVAQNIVAVVVAYTREVVR